MTSTPRVCKLWLTELFLDPRSPGFHPRLLPQFHFWAISRIGLPGSTHLPGPSHCLQFLEGAAASPGVSGVYDSSPLRPWAP